MKKLILLLSTLPLLATAKIADSGFYLNAGFGAGSLNYYSGGTTAVMRVAGGYNFNQNIGVQLGINNYFGATISNSNGTFGMSGYSGDISFLPNLPIGPNNEFSVFMRLGFGEDVLNSTYANQNNFVDVLGVGLKYDISAHLAASLEWIGRGLLTNPGEAKYTQNMALATIGFYF
ncbi:MAG: outer membrane beta-barrel protein [Neisseriaceae bacterium]